MLHCGKKIQDGRHLSKVKQYIANDFDIIDADSCFLVSIMGFLGMLDIVVLSEKTLDIIMWVKNQGQTQNRYRFVILVFTTEFQGIHVVVRKYFKHCIVGKKSNKPAMCSRSNVNLI